jgi:hypothetical protein
MLPCPAPPRPYRPAQRRLELTPPRASPARATTSSHHAGPSSHGPHIAGWSSAPWSPPRSRRRPAGDWVGEKIRAGDGQGEAGNGGGGRRWSPAVKTCFFFIAFFNYIFFHFLIGRTRGPLSMSTHVNFSLPALTDGSHPSNSVSIHV